MLNILPVAKNFTDIDLMRLQVNSELDPINKSNYGQFMTPSQIADFMAGLFVGSKKAEKLLDCGAGIGSLTLSAIKKLKNIEKIELWEIDPTICLYLRKNMKSCNCPYEIHNHDFIAEAVLQLNNNEGTRFTHAIINPPYKKINSNSEHRKILRTAGIETVNLYSAFLALTIKLMAAQGQIVAIIPRSFCNGPYYKPFRELLLNECSIDHIHIFESRNQAFKDDKVLQENIIIKLTKTHIQADVSISSSKNQDFLDYKESKFSFDKIIKPNDPECFIHIPTDANEKSQFENEQLFKYSLKDLGVNVSTGPVVDFRVTEYLELNPNENTVPLLYPHHFVNRKLAYPQPHKKKSNAIRLTEETRKLLMTNNGCYVLIRRFSAKEEDRRVVAYLVSSREINASFIGFENHWNVLHIEKNGMDEKLASGLACFLNSSILDEYFRVFSGHTQVNATDLRNMKYPSKASLIELGQQYDSSLNQAQIDQIILGI